MGHPTEENWDLLENLLKASSKTTVPQVSVIQFIKKRNQKWKTPSSDIRKNKKPNENDLLMIWSKRTSEPKWPGNLIYSKQKIPRSSNKHLIDIVILNLCDLVIWFTLNKRSLEVPIMIWSKNTFEPLKPYLKIIVNGYFSWKFFNFNSTSPPNDLTKYSLN